MVDLIKTVSIPSDMNLSIEGKKIIVQGNGKKIERALKIEGIEIKNKNNVLEVSSKKNNRKQAKMIGTIIAHVKNMFNGLKEDFVYKLEVCNVHFPMTIKVEGNKLNIKNFLGETIDRKADIVDNARVEVKGNEIFVKSFDREAAGQTAANIEKATLIKYRDRRVFQDGIYLTERAGKKI